MQFDIRPHAKRRSIRKILKTLSDYRNDTERRLRRGLEIPQDVWDYCSFLNVSDPHQLLTAITAFHEQYHAAYFKELRDLAPHDLTAFAEYINPDEPPAPHHVWMCDKLMEMEDRRIMRMLISMPPGHAKSTYSSRLYPAWYMGRNTKHKYIQAGHTTNFCENEFGKKTKAIIDSDAFREVFPDVYLATDSKAAGNWGLQGTGGQYLTRGVGQGISGFRAHMAGVDDPFASREDAESQTIRDKVFDWFSADFTTRLLPNAPMFVVATRWHSDDLCGRIEEMHKQGKGLPWDIINLAAICEDPGTDALGRSEGEPLWPDFYTKDHLLNLKATLPPRDWNSLYMGKPVDEEGGVILGEWLHTYDMLPGHNNRKRTALSVDTAIKANERNDYTAIGIWIEDMDGFHHLAHVHRARVEFPEMVKLIDNMASAWNVDVILIEDKGSGTQYIQTRAGKAPAPVVALSPNNNSKEFRLDGVAPLFQAGQVLIPKHAEWLPDYVSELLGFPTAKFDDQVDLTSQYLDWARKKVRRGNVKLSGNQLKSQNKTGAKSEIERNLAEIALLAKADPIAIALAAARKN
ncbi:MAG: phage terminase large subunit [Hoeflea sp.]|uniref:phage terminase large subunit n=1 Tax=Hoeflea sp. TaxID=1940281 RepID=UPI0032EBD3DA